MNARVIPIENIKQAAYEILNIGVDPASIQWLSPKAVLIAIKVEHVKSAAANILKQEMLGKGGDVAVHKGVSTHSVDGSDVLILGTISQYQRLVDKLSLQPFGLKKIGKEIETILQNLQDSHQRTFVCGTHRLELGKKTLVMGILNATPDSFSDGGQYVEVESAVKKAKEMIDAGADIIDVGGESTRPHYEAVEPSLEVMRVVPIIDAIAKSFNTVISVDTSKAMVAEKAMLAGASMVNDVWGLTKDPLMAEVVSKYGAGIVMMHNKNDRNYKDLMSEIIKYLRNSMELARRAGIRQECMMIDPGIGFGKTPEDNLQVMKRLKELQTLNVPILLGTSRKSFIGHVLDLPVEDRVEGTAATVAFGITQGVDVVRVHDVKEMVRISKMTDAMVR